MTKKNLNTFHSIGPSAFGPPSRRFRQKYCRSDNNVQHSGNTNWNDPVFRNNCLYTFHKDIDKGSKTTSHHAQLKLLILILISALKICRRSVSVPSLFCLLEECKTKGNMTFENVSSTILLPITIKPLQQQVKYSFH